MYKYLILIFSVVLVVSCTTSPSSSSASLTGTISLLNSEDHSGVTVALYNLAYLDTTLVRINQEYPHIGVIITQETEFDHRLQTPVKFTQTDQFSFRAASANISEMPIPAALFPRLKLFTSYTF
ncbi:MAG: hypothetical protein PHY08_11525, partial [Candidatus Cloacimonetes bacterium]|nr:hypothetical protein [Candidatus Cloacimonadota bacterium]